jgi:hypothetical protein
LKKKLAIRATADAGDGKKASGMPMADVFS